MHTLLRRTGWFALLFAFTIPLCAAPVQAQNGRSYPERNSRWDRDEEVRGTWFFTQPINDDGSNGELRYRLSLRNDGQAVMTIERTGSIRRSRFVDDSYGSILSVYLNRGNRVTHTGRWTADSDGSDVTITLTDIDGRRDNARFTGQADRGRLRLTTNNLGMYGRSVRFSFRSENNRWDRDDRPGRDRDRYDRGNGRNDRDGDDYYDNDGRYDRDRDDRRPGRPGNGFPRNDRGRGDLTWEGSVDAGAILYIRQNNVRTETTNDKGVYNARTDFNRSLPQRPVRVSVVRNEGRGNVTILEQPSRQNNYTAVVRIDDPAEGRDNYRLTISWD